MAIFLVMLHHSGPEWDAARAIEDQSNWTAHAEFMDDLVDAGFVILGGPLDDYRVVLAVETESAEIVSATLGRDPWFESHLRIDRIDPWSVRLDSRR
jgi:hypothetical protein